MAFFKQSSARHRAEAPSYAVRNTTIAAAAAGAAVIGSVAPAQAYAEVPAASGAVYSAPAPSSLADYTSYTYEAPIASYQAPAVSSQAQPAPSQAPAQQQLASPAGLSTQSISTQSLAAAGGIAGTAMQGVGGAYVWGGTAFGAWDCSGFTQWVYAQHGIDLPRTSQAQWAAGTPTSNPQPGDLVVQNGGGHIGIYLGGGKMISALNPTQGTFIHDVNAMPVVGYVTFR